MKKILTSNGKPLFKDGKVFLSDGIGGGNASIIKPGGWSGTTVPASGMIEKIYLNTNLSVEEVTAICNSLNFAEMDEAEIWACFTDETMENVLIAMIKMSASETGLPDDIYMIATSQGPVFQTFDVYNLGFTGWKPDYTGVEEINIENHLTVLAPMINFTPENDKANMLFSITPFEIVPGDPVKLSGEYDGAPISVEIINEWQGTTVPNTGYVENVYFNTSLSVEEVVGILENLTLNYGGQCELLTASSLNEEGNAQLICIIKMSETCWTIQSDTNSCSEVLFISSDDLDIGYVGWNPNITYPIVLGYEQQSSLEEEDDEGNVGVVPIGTQNNLLSTLFSTTPFTFGYLKAIDVESYLSENKLPLRFKLKVDKESFIPKEYIVPSGELDIAENGTYDVTKYASVVVGTPDKIQIDVSKTVVPNTGYVENLYINTLLSKDEVVNILKQTSINYYSNTYYVCKSGNILITISRISDDEYKIYYAKSITSQRTIFNTDYTNGWDTPTNHIYTIPINGEMESSNGVYLVGNTNSPLVNLFSTTPFFLGESITLEVNKEYTPSFIKITENGIVDTSEIIKTNNQLPVLIDTNVPIPSGYVKPSGTKAISENGVQNVKYYEYVSVDISLPSGYIQPEGTININRTGITDVTNYAMAQVTDYYLTPENIAKDITILGITGTYENIDGMHKIEDKFINGQFSADDYSNNRINVIEAYAFAGRWDGPILNETFPNCEWVLKGAFLYANRGDRVTEAHFPKCTIIGANSFEGHSYLSTIDFPKATTVEAYAFKDCSNLESINLPLVKTIGKGAFMNCYAYLKTINLPQVTSIWEQAFEFCASLSNIYLGADTKVSLSKSNAFDIVSNANVHVRAELLSEYQADTVWAEAVSKGYITLVGDYTD